MRLLHVDDDLKGAEIVARILGKRLPGWHCVVVPTLAEARAALEGGGFDVLLLDAHLPDGEGFELLKALRERGDAIATVMLTADSDQAAMRGALLAGADEFLLKSPACFEELPQAIESAQRKAANKRLENERRFRELFERLPSIAVQGYDRDRRVIFWNRASELIYGFSAEEALGCRLEDLIIPAEMRAAVVSAVSRWVENRDQAIEAGELTLKRKDGSPTQVFSSHVLLDGPKGEAELYCVDVDLNAQKRALSELAASEARYRRVVENVSDVIFHLDGEGRLSFVNRAWASLTGFSADESSGIAFADFTHPEDRDACLSLFDQTDSSEQAVNQAEFRIQHRDGSLRWVAGKTVVQELGAGRQAVYGTLTDITERVRGQLLQQTRSDVLDMIVADCDLDIVINSILAHIEMMLPEVMADILLIDRDNWVFDRSFAPSLPEAYASTFLGMEPGAQLASFGVAAHRGALVVSRDIQRDPDWLLFREPAGQVGLRSCWSMPLKDEAGDVLGTITAYRKHVHVPDSDELALVGELAALASVAVQKKRAGRQLALQEAALEQSAYSVLELMRETDFDDAVVRVLKRIGEVTQVDRIHVFEAVGKPSDTDLVLDLSQEWCREGVASQLNNPLLSGFSIRSEDGFWQTRLREGRSVFADSGDDAAQAQAFLAIQGVRSLLAVPIMVSDRLWGFVSCEAVQKRRRWSAPEESVMRIVAASIGAAVERRQSLENLRLWAAAFESTRDGVVITDLVPNIVAINHAYSEITGYSEAEVIGRNPGFLSAGRHPASFYRRIWRALAEDGHWQGEIWNRRRNGEVYPQWLNLAAVKSPRGQATHYVGVMTDITELKRSEAQLQKMAHYDPLTDLPNRTLALLRLERALSDAHRHGHSVGVLFIDLDRFKNINDSFGHPVGDELLEQIARRFSNRVRAEDTLARLGGDEFLFVLEKLEDPGDAGRVAESLIGLLDTPFTLSGGREVYVGASVGISVFPGDGASSTELIQHADAALYQAKANGRKTFSYFTPELGVAVQRRIEMETRLRHAVERGEFVLYYQPKVEVGSDRILGCEALIRWQSPELGLVSPVDFIPVAEETGLIEAIGEWVLRTACRQAAKWRKNGLPGLTMAVNVSARQLWHAALPELIAAILRDSDLDASLLEIELTESVIVGQETLAAERFGQLKSLGVKLAIDDFGTGYSSLAYLKRFPIDVLKIDRSFIRDIPGDTDDMEIAAAIVAMARALRLAVVAEGVETNAQLAFLAETACDSYQGYFFSPPVPVEDFERLLLADVAHRSDAARG